MNGMHLIDDLDRSPTRDTESKHGNWLIAPLPFKNELLGAGLVLGVGYLYGDKERGAESKHSIAGAGGMYAEGGSWAGIGAHRGYWSDERYRTTLAAISGEIRYNIALDVASTEQTIPLLQSFSGGTIEAAMRLGEDGWVGLGLLAGSTKVGSRDLETSLPEELSSPTSIELATLRLSAEYDTRDSDLYPHTGHYVDALISLARTELGSDYDYEIVELEWNTYIPIANSQVLAGRIAGTLVEGDAPFFAKAWFGSEADLRGYTPGRYIGESMFAAQAEWRWMATRRLGIVAFAGAGKVSGALGDIDTDDWLPAVGVGIRFRMTQALPLNLRADFGWGRDDSTFTLAVGEAF
jgi:outer membrane protein assembly factor BamA